MHSLQYTGAGYFPLVKAFGVNYTRNAQKGRFTLCFVPQARSNVQSIQKLVEFSVWANKPKLYTHIPGLNKLHLNNLISVGGKIRVKIISMGHTNFLELTWVQNPWPFPVFSYRLLTNTLNISYKTKAVQNQMNVHINFHQENWRGFLEDQCGLDNLGLFSVVLHVSFTWCIVEY